MAYASRKARWPARQAAADLVEIWTGLILEDFQLKPTQYFLVLAIPDAWSRAEIKAVTDELSAVPKGSSD